MEPHLNMMIVKENKHDFKLVISIMFESEATVGDIKNR